MDLNDADGVPTTEARAEARAPVPGTQTAATESLRCADRSIVDAGKSAVPASARSAWQRNARSAISSHAP